MSNNFVRACHIFLWGNIFYIGYDLWNGNINILNTIGAIFLWFSLTIDQINKEATNGNPNNV